MFLRQEGSLIGVTEVYMMFYVKSKIGNWSHIG